MSRNQAQTFAKWLQGHGAAKVGMPYMAVTPIRDAIGIKSNGNMTKTTPGTGGEKDKAGNFWHNDAMTLVVLPDTTNFLQGNYMQVHNKIMQGRGGQFKRFPLDIPSTELKQVTVLLNCLWNRLSLSVASAW